MSLIVALFSKIYEFAILGTEYEQVPGLKNNYTYF